MIGAVFGTTDGIAPGYRGSLGWGMLELYSETEFVFDAGDSADSFLYTWSEFEVAPVDWCRFGLVVQRTKVYQTEFDIQRGFFVGVSYRRADVTAYVFNPDADRRLRVVVVSRRAWASGSTATGEVASQWERSASGTMRLIGPPALPVALPGQHQGLADGVVPPTGPPRPRSTTCRTPNSTGSPRRASTGSGC